MLNMFFPATQSLCLRHHQIRKGFWHNSEKPFNCTFAFHGDWRLRTSQPETNSQKGTTTRSRKAEARFFPLCLLLSPPAVLVLGENFLRIRNIEGYEKDGQKWGVKFVATDSYDCNQSSNVRLSFCTKC
jgi:hypothetical protein